MEQKIILQFFYLIALHVFLNCHGKIFHFWKYFCSQQSKEIVWNTIKHKIWILNCRLLHFCELSTRKLLSSLIWRKIRAILKKRTDWRTVMSIETTKIVPFFPMTNEQFPSVPDDFILKLCTVPEISLSHVQMGLYLSWELLISGYRD